MPAFRTCRRSLPPVFPRGVGTATRRLHCVPQEKFPRKPYDQASSVKVAGYCPHSFFACSWILTLFRTVNTKRKNLGRVVRKPVNANPGLKVNRGNNFSCIKVLSIAYVLCSLRLLVLKTEGQKI